MRYCRQAFLFVRFLAFFFLALPSLVSAAGDPVAGKTLYNTPFSGLSCGTSGCHGGYTGANNPNKITNGANNPTRIQSAISGNTGGMGIFSGKFTATDLANIAAYIATPNASSGAPAVALSPGSLAFGSQTTNTTSAATPVTVSNTGTATLNITSVTVSAGFAQSNNCGSVAAGSSCTINVTFTPTAASAYSGSVSITDDATGSPHKVTVTGTGTSPAAPSVSLSSTSVGFGSQAVNTTSAPQPVTLQNTGNAALTISSIVASASFGQTNSCGSSLAAGASCPINITFTPAAAGTILGSITIADNAGGPHIVNLSGTGGNTPTPAVQLSGISAFASQTVGTSSVAKTITLKNTGNAALTVSSIAASGDFSQTNTCGTSVAVGASCSIAVVFTPTATGSRAGTLTVTDNAAGSPHISTLSGTGVATAVNPFTSAAGYQIHDLTLASSASSLVVGPDNNLWFVETSATKVGMLSQQGTVLGEFATKTAASQPQEIVVGPDKKLWFTEYGGNRIGMIDPATAGTQGVTEYSVPTANSQPSGIASGGGYVWFTEAAGNKIGRVDVASGTITEYSTGLTAAAGLLGIAVAGDGTVWFAESKTNRVGKLDPKSGVITEYPLQTAGNDPTAIALGPDGAMWFTMTAANKLGRIDMTGAITEYPGMSPSSGPSAIVPGASGSGYVWFTDSLTGKIAAISIADGTVYEYAVTGVSLQLGSVSAQQKAGIAFGPDGNLWVTEPTVNKMFVMSTTPPAGAAPVPVTPTASPTAGAAGTNAGGGGGCTTGRAGGDLVLPMMLMVALMYFLRRGRRSIHAVPK